MIATFPHTMPGIIQVPQMSVVQHNGAINIIYSTFKLCNFTYFRLPLFPLSIKNTCFKLVLPYTLCRLLLVFHTSAAAAAAHNSITSVMLQLLLKLPTAVHNQCTLLTDARSNMTSTNGHQNCRNEILHLPHLKIHTRLPPTLPSDIPYTLLPIYNYIYNYLF
jgi:hypothetical protein